MSGGCLVVVQRVSKRSMEGVWKVSEWCLDDARRVSGWSLKGVWEVSERFKIFLNSDGCLEIVQRLF